MNPTTAYRTGILSRKEYEIMHAERNSYVSGEDLSKARPSSAPAALVNQASEKKGER